MNTRIAILIGLFGLMSWPASAQPPAGLPKPPSGSGTPGTVPVWTGTATLGDSRITSGATVSVAAPLRVNGGSEDAIVGTTDGATGVTGFASGTGVLGFSTGFSGVTGITNDSGISAGVFGMGPTLGVFGSTAACDGPFVSCVTTSGIAGLFWSGPGGTVVRGVRVNPDGTRDQALNVTAEGDLTISGNAYKPGGGTWSTLSDERAKTTIRPLTNSLERLLDLRGVTFQYTDAVVSQFGERPGLHVGMVAQQVEQVFPSWVDMGADGYKRLTFRGFEAVAVEAIRELDTRVTTTSRETLERIAELEKQNAALRRAIETLLDDVRVLQQR